MWKVINAIDKDLLLTWKVFIQKFKRQVGTNLNKLFKT
jgi:hypothetical protein